MAKIFTYSLEVLSYYFFNGVTFYCMINLFKKWLNLQDSDVSELKIYSSAIVALFASIYWLIRGFNAIMELPYKKRERKIKERISELEELQKRSQILNEMTKEDIKKLLENDNK
jgi:hypothetical protein